MLVINSAPAGSSRIGFREYIRFDPSHIFITQTLTRPEYSLTRVTWVELEKNQLLIFRILLILISCWFNDLLTNDHPTLISRMTYKYRLLFILIYFSDNNDTIIMQTFLFAINDQNYKNYKNH